MRVVFVDGTINKVLRGLREAKGLKQTQIACNSHISQQTVSRIDSETSKELTMFAVNQYAIGMGLPFLGIMACFVKEPTEEESNLIAYYTKKYPELKIIKNIINA